jgi:hypothetical protein
MQERHRKLVAGFLATALMGCGLVSSAAGQTIDANALGAAVVVPWQTGGDGVLGERATVIAVTNAPDGQGVSSPFSLHIVVFDDQWNAADFLCPLTPHETTFLVFERDEFGSKFTFECSNAGLMGPDPEGTNNRRLARPQDATATQGFVFINIECQIDGSPECPGGTLDLRTKGDNVLLASATVIDFARGYAYSVGAIHIQGLANNNGDRLYLFDGDEYAYFPSMLATNYIAPDSGITAELILLTVDGRANDRALGGGVSITSRVFVRAFDDDENLQTRTLDVDCFRIIDLEDEAFLGTSARRDLSIPQPGPLVGHLQLMPAPVPASDSIENDPRTGDGNGQRLRMVHGWIVQTIAGRPLGDTACSMDSECPADSSCIRGLCRRGVVGPADQGVPASGPFPTSGSVMPASGAWGRILVQGTNPLLPIGGDISGLFNGPPPL